MGSLRVIRPFRPLVDRWHFYTVMIDGGRVGRIANGETVEIPIATGSHTLKVASIILLASRGCGEVDFTILGDETVGFAVHARVPLLEPFPWLHPSRWIDLTPVAPP